jgi:hypothetical protein|tara:strand:+ start:474 stop:680 length:207 start_codon:yes stop_codon:yes gene_type:complete
MHRTIIYCDAVYRGRENDLVVFDIQSDLIGLGDMAENVLFPACLDVRIEVQIVPAIGDVPRLRVDIGL